MSFASRVARNTSILLGTHFLTYPISLVVFALLGRHLQEDGLGRFNYVSSVLSLFFLCTSFGLDILLVREVARRREQTRQYINAVLSLKLVLSSGVALVYFLYVFFSSEPTELKHAFYLAGLALWFTAWSNSFQAIFNAHEKMIYRGITLLALNLVQLFGVIVVILLDRRLVSSVLVYHVLGSASGMLTAGYWIHTRFTPFRPRLAVGLWKDLLRQSISFLPVEVAGRIYLLADIVLVRLILSSDSMTGWFSASKKLLEAVHLITSALTQALYPALAHRFASAESDPRATFRQMFKLILLLALPTGIFIAFCARGIIDLVYGLERYEESVHLLRGFGLVAIVMICDAFVTYFAFVLRLERAVRRVALTRIPLNVAASALLIYFWGAMGGVVACGLSSVYNLTACAFLVRRQLGALGLLRVMGKPLLVNACFALLLWPMRSWNILAAVAVAGAGYALLLWVFRELGRQQLEQMGLLRSQERESSAAESPEDEEKKAE